MFSNHLRCSSVELVCARDDWLDRGRKKEGNVLEKERKKKRHVAENMFRDVPWAGLHGDWVCVCVWTISVSMHLCIGVAEREDSEDICIKASRFHFDSGACVYAWMCVWARAWALSFYFYHIRTSAVFPGVCSVPLVMGWQGKVQPWQPQGVSLR